MHLVHLDPLHFVLNGLFVPSESDGSHITASAEVENTASSSGGGSVASPASFQVQFTLYDDAGNVVATNRSAEATAQSAAAVAGTGADSAPTTTIVRGDAVSLSIAAASIVAKVTRDRLMREWDAHHSAYGFIGNKGYPCPRHKAALAAHGPSAVHRRRWAFMDDLRWTALPRIVEDDEAQLGLF